MGNSNMNKEINEKRKKVVEIHCYKHNGKIHSVSKDTMIIEEKQDYIVCGNFRTKVTEDDGKTYYTKEPAIIFFYKNNWFNIIAQFKEYGLFYYCNIASPYLIDENVIKYIDYDLDLRVFPDGGYKVLDKNEYKYHKKIMHYNNKLDLIINKELEKLIKMKKNHEGPFNKEIINSYLKKYLVMKNLNN